MRQNVFSKTNCHKAKKSINGDLATRSYASQVLKVLVININK